jgi:hypothetical protein
VGYTTEFEGEFTLTRKMTDQEREYLQKFSETRRMARKLPARWGVEGEFYIDGGGFMGQDHEKSIIDYNRPPKTQPGLWCQWEPNEEGTTIRWNGGEKFYRYVEWLRYILEKFLIPAGNGLSGSVTYRGEDDEDKGTITVADNQITLARG